VLASKFRVERVIGKGGMGVVLEAMNIQLDQKVALKLLHTGADDPATVERFSQEARAAARLKSEHVARVFDVGHDATHGPYIVMEYLDGRTLAEVLTTTGRIPVHRAVEYVIDACEGLAEAHVRDIVHQDVKPANLFLVTGNDGRPAIKVLDFGIATMRSNTTDRVQDSSSNHRNAGTPAYLAPEQLRGTPKPDHRVDVWALGCVLYELIVAQRAFQSMRFTELVTQILESPHAPYPADIDIPPPIKDVIDRCLERDRDKRFASTGELALALLPFARRRAHSSVARAVAHVTAGGLDPNLEMPSSMPPPPSSSGENLSDTLPSSAHLRAANKVPSFGSVSVSTTTDVSTSTSQDVAAPNSTAQPKRGGYGLLLVGLFSLVLVSVSAFFAWTKLSSPTKAAGTTAASTASPPPESWSAVPTASTMTNGVVTAPTDPAGSANVASSSGAGAGAGVVPAKRTAIPWRPPTTARPATSPVAPHPTSTESEIRHTR